ncbi:primosome subunit DnaD [Calderihabitans maritimus]|uniref:Primosome subunit DnaD n=1 Tax=Calderihabitans maritimus TaxID=1246530 RepID=A0A1Z5HRB9_9FIRM|nr:primosome subunit DnaD [Calderihabitans maritimus]
MKAYKPNFTAEFAMDLYSAGSVVLPELLLRCYSQLGITEMELVLIIHMWRLRQMEQEYYPSPEKLSAFMAADKSTIEELIANLIEKKVLEVVRQDDESLKRPVEIYSFRGLFEKLAEIWACERATQSRRAGETLEGLGEVYQAFEKEFGRLLSPMEGEKIVAWLEEDKFPPELVLEALKRAVLRGILNFNYIDSILRQWAKKNLRTVREINEYERKFYERQNLKGSGQRTAKVNRSRKEKFKDIYLS